MLSIVSDDLRSQAGTAVAQPTQAALHSVLDRCVQSVQCVVSICHPEFICCRLQSVTFVLCVRQDNQRIKITRKESSKWIFYTLKWRPFIWWINCIFFPRDSGWFYLIFRMIHFCRVFAIYALKLHVQKDHENKRYECTVENCTYAAIYMWGMWFTVQRKEQVNQTHQWCSFEDKASVPMWQILHSAIRFEEAPKCRKMWLNWAKLVSGQTEGKSPNSFQIPGVGRAGCQPGFVCIVMKHEAWTDGGFPNTGSGAGSQPAGVLFYP